MAASVWQCRVTTGVEIRRDEEMAKQKAVTAKDVPESKSLEQRIVDEMKRQAIRDAAAKAIDRLQRYVDPDESPTERSLRVEESVQAHLDALLARMNVDDNARWDLIYDLDIYHFLDTTPLPRLTAGTVVFDAVTEFIELVPEDLLTITQSGKKLLPSPVAELWHVLLNNERDGGERIEDYKEFETYMAEKRDLVDAMCLCLRRLGKQSEALLDEPHGPPEISVPWIVGRIKDARDTGENPTSAVRRQLDEWDWERVPKLRENQKTIYYEYTAERSKQLQGTWSGVNFPAAPPQA